MTITAAFGATVTALILTGAIFRRWDASRYLRFLDEAGSTSAVLPLARTEGRRLALHPGWVATLVFFGAVTVLLSHLDDQTVSAGAFEGFTYIALPLGGLALVVVGHRIGTRSRRNHLDELEAATPTAPRARTAALLVACLWPGAVAVFAAVVLTVAVRLVVPRPAPVTGDGLVALGGFVLVVCGGAIVGVLLSRWLPMAAAPILGVVAILFLNNGPDHLHPRFRWLRPAVEMNVGGVFDIRPDRWQLVFVTSLLALGACLALLRHPPTAPVVVSTAVTVAVLVAVGWTMTRPPSAAQVAAVVDRLHHPTTHQRCETRRDVRFCTYPGAEDWVDGWAQAISAVLAQVPAEHRPARLEVVQREPVRPWSYLDEVERAIDPSVAWAADGRIHPSLTLDTSSPDLTVAWQAAAVAVGLPPSVDWRRPSGCMAGGQARFVLSLALAARATGTTRSALHWKADWVRDWAKQLIPVSADTEWDYSPDAPGVEIPAGARLAADGASEREFVAVAGASGWGTDLLAAEALLDATDARLTEVISSRWDELVDPSTTTSELLTWAGATPIAGIPALPMDDPRSCP